MVNQIQKVLLLENSRLMGEKIASLFSRRNPDIEITHITSSLRLMETARKTSPDLMLLDIRLINQSDNLINRLVREFPAATVMIMATDTGESYTRRAEKMGAHGLVGKQLLERFIQNLFKPVQTYQPETS